MNKGAILLRQGFFTDVEIQFIAETARQFEQEKSNVHTSGRYAGIQWHQVALDPERFPWLKKIYGFLSVDQAELAVFYYLSPGAVLHPHRDLTGASLNNRLRFHVPVI